MTSAVSWLDGGMLLNVVSLGLGALGLMLSFYFYVKSKREKKPVFLTKTYSLVKNQISAIPGLSISFNETPIKSLSLTKLAFWNSGTETINCTDIVNSDPLRIDGTELNTIVGAKISFTRRSVSNIEVRLVENIVQLSFDYLDKNDGAIVDIYHTEPLKINVSGTIKGCETISVADPSIYWEKRANRVLERLPDPNRFRYIGFFIFAIYSPIIFAVLIPLVLSYVYTKVFIKIPKEYSLE